MAVDAWGFDSDRQAKAHRLRTLRFRLSIARTGALVSLVVGLVIVGSASLRDAVLSLRWPSWTSTILFLAVLYLAFFAVELPFTYVGGYRWEKASGLSSQSMWGWMKDLAKTAGLGLGASVVAGGVLLWLLATSTWWWLVAWLLGLIASAILRLPRVPSGPRPSGLGLCRDLLLVRDSIAGGHGRIAVLGGALQPSRPPLSSAGTPSVAVP